VLNIGCGAGVQDIYRREEGTAGGSMVVFRVLPANAVPMVKAEVDLERHPSHAFTHTVAAGTVPSFTAAAPSGRPPLASASPAFQQQRLAYTPRPDSPHSQPQPQRPRPRMSTTAKISTAEGPRTQHSTAGASR
jgi:hypothetical protein